MWADESKPRKLIAPPFLRLTTRFLRLRTPYPNFSAVFPIVFAIPAKGKPVDPRAFPTVEIILFDLIQLCAFDSQSPKPAPRLRTTLLRRFKAPP